VYNTSLPVSPDFPPYIERDIVRRWYRSLKRSSLPCSSQRWRRSVHGLIARVNVIVHRQEYKSLLDFKFSLQLRPTRSSATATLYFHPRNESLAYSFAADSMGLFFIRICAVGSKRRIFSAAECVLVVQGRSRSYRSMILVVGTNRKHVYATSY